MLVKIGKYVGSCAYRRSYFSMGLCNSPFPNLGLVVVVCRAPCDELSTAQLVGHCVGDSVNVRVVPFELRVIIVF